MDKILGNYSIQKNRDFPLDCETLDYIANNQAMCEMLGNIAGDKIILSGCELQSGNLQRSEGYVFLRTTDFPKGEVLRWEGGAVGSGMYVKKTDTSVTANGYTYPKAYTTRSLAPGTGTENYSWSDFTDITESTNKALKSAYDALKTEVDALVGEPLGIIKMWAGSDVPSNYHLCDGSSLSKSNYESLYNAIGYTFGGSGDTFNLPDLQGRFIVGKSKTDSDYTTTGTTGGEKKHQLTVDEMPSHRHNYTDDDYAKNKITEASTEYVQALGDISASGNGGGSLYHTSATGGDTPHENRPPYFVLAYIMKIS